MRDDEGALEREDAAGDQRLQKERIGHAVDTRAAEVPVEQRVLGLRRHDVALDARLAQRTREPVGQIRIDFAGRRPPGRLRPIVQGIQTLDGDTAGGGGGIGRHGGRIVRQRLAHRGTPVIEAPERHEQQIEGRGPDDRSGGDDERRTKTACRFAQIATGQNEPCYGHNSDAARRGARTARGSTSTSGGAEATRTRGPNTSDRRPWTATAPARLPTARTTTPAPPPTSGYQSAYFAGCSSNRVKLCVPASWHHDAAVVRPGSIC